MCMCTRSCKKEGVSSSWSTLPVPAVQAQALIKPKVPDVLIICIPSAARHCYESELLVKALTGNLLPSALLDSPAFRDFLVFQKKRCRILPERLGKCIFLRQNSRFAI